MRKAVVLFVTWMLSAGLASASVPPMINYQGKLMQPSGAAVPDGTYSMTFAIYDVPTGGTALWSETNPSVQVKGGLFAVLLGSVTNLPANIFDSPDRWFGVKVGSDPEMTPRQRVASVAYAQVAGNGVPVGGIIMWSGLASQIPPGWKLCDGTNGTPDLRDRFVVGAGGGYSVGATGGEATHTLTVAEMPTHNHQAASSRVGANQGYDSTLLSTDPPGGSHGAEVMASMTGGNQPHENRPPYYALCFIMKVGGL